MENEAGAGLRDVAMEVEAKTICGACTDTSDSDMGDRAWGRAQRAAEGQTLSSSNIVPPTSRGAVLRPMPDYG